LFKRNKKNIFSKTIKKLKPRMNPNILTQNFFIRDKIFDIKTKFFLERNSLSKLVIQDIYF
jgi:hypothetical protein